MSGLRGRGIVGGMIGNIPGDRLLDRTMLFYVLGLGARKFTSIMYIFSMHFSHLDHHPSNESYAKLSTFVISCRKSVLISINVRKFIFARPDIKRHLT